MKYLLYYKLDSNFIADQVKAGGDGTNVVSVVDGVAWTNDQDKVYYRYANNNSENIRSYTVTIHYRDIYNNVIAPDETYVVDAYVGKSASEFLSPASISGYTALDEPKKIVISGNTEYTFKYIEGADFKDVPLIFVIASSGTIYWKATNSSYTRKIQYKINGGNWANITSYTGNSAPSISVNAGDVVQFRGDNSTYGNSSNYNSFSGTTAKFEIEGNIMSLIDSTNFATATTLATSYTFYYLFYNCTGLTSAENLVLPATTLISDCYNGMFQGCTSLTKAPELPATKLAGGCYGYMFYGCTSLTTAPELPATTLAASCYSNMLNGCTSLTTAPELPATTLENFCYEYMFYGCASLKTAPALPATTLKTRCYGYMFLGCTSLTTAPALPAITLEEYCYQNMFQACTSLTIAPSILPAKTLTGNCYQYMFQDCTSLTKAPELPATTLASNCYNGMFSRCTSLTTGPELPATVLGFNCYSGMFSRCTSLITAPALPATTLTDSCYANMFQGCASLTTAPELPATTLARSCYYAMFSDCTSLNYIKCLATNISASYCTPNWVYGVASSGTFVKNPNMSSWTTGNNGIPTNWTVQDA